MPDQDLIDGLVATYRALNLNVRQLPEEKLNAEVAGSSVRDIVSRMRDDELRFSQALKARLSGIEIPDIFGQELPAIGTESPDDRTPSIIAQFGTARESTLAMLRGLPDPDWDQAIEGGKTIRTRVFELVDNDRKNLDRVASLIGPA